MSSPAVAAPLENMVLRAALAPKSVSVSRMYMNGTLRSWIHFIELRSSNGTQKEHMLIARACAEVIEDIELQ